MMRSSWEDDEYMHEHDDKPEAGPPATEQGTTGTNTRPNNLRPPRPPSKETR